MKKIIIFYEHVTREYDACISIKNHLEKNKDIKVWVLSMHYEIANSYLLSMTNEIDLIFVPFLYKDSSLSSLSFLINKKRPPLIVNFHHEQISSKFTEKKLLPHGKFAINEVYHLAWDKCFADQLLSIGVKPERIFITDNIRRPNFPCQNIEKRNEFSKIFNLDKNKKWLLFCESGAKIFNKKLIQQRSKWAYSKKDMERWNITTKRALNATKIDLNNISDKFFEEYEIIYRKHPGDVENYSLNKRIKLISTYSIENWLETTDIVVSRLSTVILDAFNLGIASFRYDPVNQDSFFIPKSYSKIPTIQKISNINEKKIRNIKKMLNYDISHKEKVLENINKALNKIMQKNRKNLNYSMPKSFIFIKKIFSSIIFNLFFKLNLLFIISKTSSFKNYYDDIPPRLKTKKG